MSNLKAKDPTLTSPGKIKMMTFSKPGIGKTWIEGDARNLQKVHALNDLVDWEQFVCINETDTFRKKENKNAKS